MYNITTPFNNTCIDNSDDDNNIFQGRTSTAKKSMPIKTKLSACITKWVYKEWPSVAVQAELRAK